MTVEYPTARVSYKGNGSTRTFSFNFPIRKEEHLQVTTTNLTTMEVKILNLGADYDVVPIDNTYPSDGGSINYPRDISTPSLTEGMSITITRVVPYTQPDIYSENSTLIPKQIENSLDNLEYQIQQINDKADSSVHIPDGVDYSNDEFVAELFDKASEASQSAQTATSKAQEAKESATSAKESEDKALDYAKRAEQASGSVGNPVNDVVVKDNKITVTKGVGGSTEYTVNNVENATKATNDGNGNTINTTYLKLSGGTMNGNVVMGTGKDVQLRAPNLVGFVFNSDYLALHDWNDINFGFVFYYRRDEGIFTVVKNVTAPTPTLGDNSGRVATTAFVKNQKYLQRKDTVNAQGLDFNSYTDDGMYNYGGTFTNSYSNGSVFGTLVVLNNLYNGGSGTSGTYISQTAYDANGDIYVRYRNGTQGWSAWRKFFKEPTRTVLMDTWQTSGDIELSESWRNFDELVFACTDDSKSNLDFDYIKTADLANWLSDGAYPSNMAVGRWSWTLKRDGTTNTTLKLNTENSGVAKVIGIKY